MYKTSSQNLDMSIITLVFVIFDNSSFYTKSKSFRNLLSFHLVRMLSNLVKEHNQQQSLRREEQEVKRLEAVRAASELTEALVDHLNVGVAQVRDLSLSANTSIFAFLPVTFWKSVFIFLNTTYFWKAYLSYFMKLYLSESTTKYAYKNLSCFQPLNMLKYA